MRNMLIIYILLSICNTLYAQDKYKIAVLDLTGEGISSSEARIITSRLRANIFETEKFIVVERNRMNEILAEQGFQMSGCTSEECAVEAGRLLGVRIIVVGDVGKIGKIFTISIRLIDVETGKLLKVATKDCECSIEKFLKQTINEVAYNIAGKKNISKTNYQTQYYVAPFGGYGFHDGQKLGFGVHAGIIFGRKFVLGAIFTKHNGTDETTTDESGYVESTYVKATYIGAELGYIFRRNQLIVYPYIMAGYVTGDDEYSEEWDGGAYEYTGDLGPMYVGGGILINFKINNKISIGPDIRFAAGAPEHELAVFFLIGINL